MMGTDTTKDAALRLCAEVVEERDEAVALLRASLEPYEHSYTSRGAVDNSIRHFLARLDGRTG